jgi:DNA relaxase NicK
MSNWRGHGYNGQSAGGARFGVRFDTWIAVLTSDVARARWREVCQHAANVSRLDVQLTVAFNDAQRDIVSELHQEAINARGARGRRTNYTLISSTLTGDSLYIGQRSSDRYMRCYDKGLEQKIAERGKLLRYEVEFKRRVAKAVASSMIQTESEHAYVAGTVSEHFARRRVRVPINGEEPRWDASSLTMSTTERKLRWLHSAIRPTIELLISQGRTEDVLRALGCTGKLELVESDERSKDDELTSYRSRDGMAGGMSD